MHISTIVRDCAWFKYLGYTAKEKGSATTWQQYLTASTTLALSLLHGAAFIGAMYVAMDLVFSQYELASPLPICTIIFTALYGVTELFLAFTQCLESIADKYGFNDIQNIDHLKSSIDGDNKKVIIKMFLSTNRIGMAGMIACAVAGVVEYFNSGTHVPCMLQTLAEKIHFSPEIIAGSIAAAIAVLLGLYILSVYGRDKTIHSDITTFGGTVKERVMTELKGFVAPCLGG